jgi:hypothetical protein
MPTTGSYSFNLAPAAVGGVVQHEDQIPVGCWAWIDRTADYEASGVKGAVRWLMIYARCPDCTYLSTLYRRRSVAEPVGHDIGKDGNGNPSALHTWQVDGATEPVGHDIDKGGNVNPSVLHTWQVDGVEQCGFHTQPTRLLDFMDLRSP